MQGLNVLAQSLLPQREMEFSGLHISYNRDGQDLPTALRFARLEACVEPPRKIPRPEGSAVALSAGGGVDDL